MNRRAKSRGRWRSTRPTPHSASGRRFTVRRCLPRPTGIRLKNPSCVLDSRSSRDGRISSSCRAFAVETATPALRRHLNAGVSSRVINTHPGESQDSMIIETLSCLAPQRRAINRQYSPVEARQEPGGSSMVNLHVLFTWYQYRYAAGCALVKPRRSTAPQVEISTGAKDDRDEQTLNAAISQRLSSFSATLSP